MGLFSSKVDHAVIIRGTLHNRRWEINLQARVELACSHALLYLTLHELTRNMLRCRGQLLLNPFILRVAKSGLTISLKNI